MLSFAFRYIHLCLSVFICGSFSLVSVFPLLLLLLQRVQHDVQSDAGGVFADVAATFQRIVFFQAHNSSRTARRPRPSGRRA